MSYHTRKKKREAMIAKMARWRQAKERKRIEGAMLNPIARPRDEGAFIGTIDIRIGDTVRRYRLCQGPRRNNLRIEAQGREVITGWDVLLSKLRKHLAPFTRQAI